MRADVCNNSQGWVPRWGMKFQWEPRRIWGSVCSKTLRLREEAEELLQSHRAHGTVKARSLLLTLDSWKQGRQANRQTLAAGLAWQVTSSLSTSTNTVPNSDNSLYTLDTWQKNKQIENDYFKTSHLMVFFKKHRFVLRINHADCELSNQQLPFTAG